MKEKTNTFAEMENSATKQDNAAISGGEMKVSDLSDTAIGDKVKYNRPSLDGKEDVIEKFQIFMPDTTKAPSLSQSGTSEYWKVSMLMTYESKNDEGINNREYLSGAICFKQKDGSASQPSFWYNGCGHQSGMLWELVSDKLGIEPEELSPRQFVAFLNNKPKVKIAAKEYKNFNAPAGSPKTVSKNMPGEFL